jgi:IMP dehydrogenase
LTATQIYCNNKRKEQKKLKNPLPLGLTFDDILLLPGYTDFFRSDIDLSTRLTKHISIKLPLVSAPMDTVTESRLAITLAKLGGIGIIHRNLTIEDQVAEAKKVLAQNLLVGVAIGTSPGYEKRVAALADNGIKLLVIDTAHGFAKYVIDALGSIKHNYPHIDIIAGSIATADGAKAMIDAGADGLRVGMGPGAICTTRVISGMGVPQITALQSVVSVATPAGIPVIADGGIKYSGDMVKALAVGANAVMMGSFFAAAEGPRQDSDLKKGPKCRTDFAAFSKKIRMNTCSKVSRHGIDRCHEKRWRSSFRR